MARGGTAEKLTFEQKSEDIKEQASGAPWESGRQERNTAKGLRQAFSLSAILVVSSAYLNLLIFLLAILIPACDSVNQ